MKEKLVNIEERYNEIINGYSDLDEIGILELNSTWQELDKLKNEAIALSTDLLVGITRDSNGKFVSKNNVEFDLKEIADISSFVDKFTDRAYSDIHRIRVEERSKSDRAMDDVRERRRVRDDIRRTNDMISNLETEINAINAELGKPSQQALDELAKAGISYTPSVNISPDRKFYLEQELAAKENSLNNFKKSLETYTLDEQRLTEEIDILRIGGKLPEMDELDFTEENEMAEDNEKDYSRDIDNNADNDLNNTIVTPTSSDVPGFGEDSTALDDEPLIPIDMPIDLENDGENNTDNVADEEDEKENSDNIIPVAVPVPSIDEPELNEIGEELENPEGISDGSEEDNEEELEDPLAAELDPMIDAVPEEGRSRAEVTEAKPSLLSKMKKILPAALAFLNAVGLYGIAYHLAKLDPEFTTINQTIITRESDKDSTTDDKEDDEEKNKDNDKNGDELDKNNPTPSIPSSGSTSGNGGSPSTTPDVTPSTPSTPDVTPSTPTNPTTPDNTVNNSGEDIKLGQGEEAVNLATGTSITNDGTRYDEGTKQDKVELEHDENGVATVKEDLINTDLVQSDENENAIDLSEVDEKLSQGEKDNLFDAINEEGPVNSEGFIDESAFTQEPMDEYGSFDDYRDLFEDSQLTM